MNKTLTFSQCLAYTLTFFLLPASPSRYTAFYIVYGFENLKISKFSLSIHVLLLKMVSGESEILWVITVLLRTQVVRNVKMRY